MAERLSKYESEIATATQELADGFVARGELQPELQSAAQAMVKAVADFSKDDWDGALRSEQRALRELIRARQNIRRMLSKSSSQSSSASRKFDRQQRQKLRKPEEIKKDQQQQLAESRQELEQLAQQQRKWSEELSPKNSGDPSQQQSPQQQQQQQKSNSQSGSSSSSSSAQAQQKMLDKLQELREKLASQNANTPAGEEAADQAAEAMRESLEKLAGERQQDSAEAGKQAAEELDRLAQHLANMNAQDAGERLKQSQQLADRLAAEQKEVSEQISGGSSKPNEGASGGESAGPSGQAGGAMSDAERADIARRERGLATQAKMLQELLAGLQSEDLGATEEVAQELRDAVTENSPQEIGEQMNDAAEKLESDDATSAAKPAADAAQQLEELAGAIRGVRSGFAQPQLEELLELESKVAELHRRLRSGDGAAERQGLGEEFDEIAPRLDQLASGDERLAQAMEQLRNPSSTPGKQAGGGQQATGGQPNETGPVTEVTTGPYWQRLSPGGGELKGVAKALQLKIQEAILAAALQDADEPVPPQYRQLVDDYYQALSDDLQ
jgi:myosin heavy subunit